MLLAEIARTSRAVAGASARRDKTELLARCLRDAGPAHAAVTVSYLSGELPQRQIGVGYAALRELPAPAGTADPSPPADPDRPTPANGPRPASRSIPADSDRPPGLTVAEVDAAFTEIGGLTGKGSVAGRRALLADLLGRATREEQDFVIRLLTGELRQGALDGVMADAVAAAASVPTAEVRRAAMLRGALPPVATVALTRGVAGLREFGLEVGRPIRPMLAASAPSMGEAFAKLAVDKPGAPPMQVAVEWKLDGIRAQIHLADGTARVFTRTLDDITDRLPEVVAALRELPVRSAVFDGELIALRPDGRPHPFQVTSARTASRVAPDRPTPADEPRPTSRPAPTVLPAAPGVPLSVFLFDVLHLDGADLLDRPGAERHAALAAAAPGELLMPRLVTESAAAAGEFFADAVAHGHEGAVVKSLDTPYTAGRRGAGWVKVKPRHTLDLVVLAAEWGHGRRRGTLSNLHLGARDPSTGGFVMLGKTFKGLTDAMLAWQTERLQELAVDGDPDAWTVRVRPELVVEIAFDGVQRSSRYPGGMALRFARVLRHRPDKVAAEADTVETVRDIAAFSD